MMRLSAQVVKCYVAPSALTLRPNGKATDLVRKPLISCVPANGQTPRWWPEPPPRAGISGKKKGPEIIRAFRFGGGWLIGIPSLPALAWVAAEMRKGSTISGVTSGATSGGAFRISILYRDRITSGCRSRRSDRCSRQSTKPSKSNAVPQDLADDSATCDPI